MKSLNINTEPRSSASINAALEATFRSRNSPSPNNILMSKPILNKNTLIENITIIIIIIIIINMIN